MLEINTRVPEHSVEVGVRPVDLGLGQRWITVLYQLSNENQKIAYSEPDGTGQGQGIYTEITHKGMLLYGRGDMNS